MKRIFFLFIITFLIACFLSVNCMAQELDATSSTGQYAKSIFPNIKPDMPIHSINWMNHYGKQRNLQPLAKNHMRYFEQPMGIVSEAIDIDLITGDLLIYPPTHDKGPVRKTKVNSDGLAELKGILTSKKFQDIPSQNKKFGMDGTSQVIEADIDGSYSWKAHWVSDDPNFIDTVTRISRIFSMAWINDYIQKLGLQSLQTNQVRLIEYVGKDVYVTYEIDFAASTLRYYKKDEQTEKKLDAPVINKLKQILSSKEFQCYTERPLRVSGDGKAIFIEVDIDGSCSRNVYSLLDRNEQLRNIVTQIRKTRF